MTDPWMWAAVSGAGLAGMVVVSVTALKGWRDWIGLQRLSLDAHGSAGEPIHDAPRSATRIELADVKERVRKLEAIAAGVDL
jgi:hypothetical protein